MWARLLSLLRGGRGESSAGATYRLCRLRHATLHPGAALWTPGVGGGNLGGGASEALDDAGIGGLVVVGFQASAREPVHPQGVVARVEERVPFPDTWSPEGLGASHRYRLTGLSRVRLDPASSTNKRVPTITTSPAESQAEDAMAAPPELVELLASLSKLENTWPEHWLDAFRALPEAPLGQWATTLGWRLAREERLQLFDQPSKIAEVLWSTLDGLHLGLAPERRREAVRTQTLTRRTSVMPERAMTVVLDEDGWALFHPADMAAPGAEQVFDAAPQHQSPAPQGQAMSGNAVIVRGSAGREAHVRITVGALTADESAARASEATFRLLVRHGRLFLGGASLVRVGYQDRLEFADPQQWLDVPHGLYRAVVTTLSAAPESVPRPDFVVQLQPEGSLDDIVTAPDPTSTNPPGPAGSAGSQGP